MKRSTFHTPQAAEREREEGEKRDGGKEAREGGREDRGRREGGWEIRRRRGGEEEQHSSEKLIRR